MAVVAILLFVSSFRVIFGANILMTNDMPSPSHQLLNYALAQALVARGHNVTLLGLNIIKEEKQDNYHHLVLEDIFADVMRNYNQDDMAHYNTVETIIMLLDYSIKACNHTYNNKGFKTLMSYPKDFKFDLILFDLTGSNCLLPLIQRFGYPPAIGVTALLLPPYLSLKFGNSFQPSYVPSLLSSYSDEMGFFQRIHNFFILYADSIWRDGYMQNEIEMMALQAFGKDLHPFSVLENHVSLLLCNWSPVLHYIQPLTPNVIPVGGLHIKSEPLPKDLQEIMDKSEDGVILFALGTNMQSNRLSLEKRQMILEAFSQIKQTVLWKFESQISSLPKNVIIRKWLPQNDLLAHPNLKLFISHGGGLSTLEAAHFGVPVLGMPFFLDQHMNIDNLVRKGGARKIDYDTITSQDLLDNINEILHNPLYSNAMKTLSKRTLDQPQTPMERAVFWVEYSMRHNGTHFLNPKSRELSMFVTSGADIYLFFMSVICILLYLIWKVLQVIKRYTFKTDKQKTH